MKLNLSMLFSVYTRCGQPAPHAEWLSTVIHLFCFGGRGIFPGRVVNGSHIAS